jgi:hypothetical protein
MDHFFWFVLRVLDSVTLGLSGSRRPAATILLLSTDDMMSPHRDELGQVKST